MTDIISKLVEGKTPSINYGQTYQLRETLLSLNHLIEQPYLIKEPVYNIFTKQWSKPEQVKRSPIASESIAGKSFIVNHGHFKTKETFVLNQTHTITEYL
jgi:hypothetical protein